MKDNSNNILLHQFWLAEFPTPYAQYYRPVAYIECRLNFRSLRAGYHHSEERIYTTWYPESNLPVDWDVSPITLTTHQKLASQPMAQLPQKAGDYRLTAKRFQELEDTLIDQLNRKEMLKLLYNSTFKLYSTPEEPREDFIDRVSELAMPQIEARLRELMRQFELKLERVREAEERKGRKLQLPEPDLMKMLEQRYKLLTSKSRLASVFLSGARVALRPARVLLTGSADLLNRELHETLTRLEQEACDAVNRVYEQFLDLSTHCESFEIGLQPQNIQVVRRAVLWLAV
jgi:hypothetical protein